MKKSFSLALLIPLVCAMFALPLFVHAAPADELREQIAALFLRVQELQAMLDIIESGNANTSTGSANASCPVIARNLGIGSEGADVTALQRFLAADVSIYPEGTVSGYFGSLTERAIQRWQTKQGIVSSGAPGTTGYGAVGPQTRNALQNCGGASGQVGGIIKVTPISGNAPLTVNATATVNAALSCSSATYFVNFGDGSTATAITVPQGHCAELVKNISHTYTSSGTYTVTLSVGSHQTTVKVQVGTGAGSTGNANNNGTQSTDSLTLTPLSGTVPLRVDARFLARSGDPYEINWGDGRPVTASGVFTQRSSLPANGTVFTQPLVSTLASHTYTTSGTHAVVLKYGRYEREGDLWVWRTRFLTGQVAVTGSATGGSVSGGVGGNSIVASPSNGAVPLTVTFNVRVNGNSSCSSGTYSLQFGDGNTADLPFGANTCAPQDFVVTHRFDSPGTYTVRLFAGPATQIANASEVGNVTISATGGVNNQGIFSISANVDNNPKKIKVTFGLNGSACTSYRLSWGDSTDDITHDAGSATTCATDTVVKEFSHTYATSSTYSVKLRRDRGALVDLTSADEEAATIVISGN